MIDWRNYERVTIFKGKDENGNRLLTQFLKDYKETFNVQEINAGCERCLNDYYTKTINYLNTMSEEKQKCDYRLKKKYENIQKEFGSREFVNNANLTNEVAEFLLENHARGAMLFDIMPEDAPVKKESEETTPPTPEAQEKTDADLTLKQLKEKYPDVKPASKKAVMLKRIEEYNASKSE